MVIRSGFRFLAVVSLFTLPGACTVASADADATSTPGVSRAGSVTLSCAQTQCESEEQSCISDADYRYSRCWDLCFQVGGCDRCSAIGSTDHCYRDCDADSPCEEWQVEFAKLPASDDFTAACKAGFKQSASCAGESADTSACEELGRSRSDEAKGFLQCLADQSCDRLAGEVDPCPVEMKPVVTDLCQEFAKACSDKSGLCGVAIEADEAAWSLNDAAIAHGYDCLDLATCGKRSFCLNAWAEHYSVAP